MPESSQFAISPEAVKIVERVVEVLTKEEAI
jgi:hypothetical protein